MAQPTRLRAQNTERKKVTKKINMSISIYSISHIRVISDYSTGRAESIFLSVAVTDEYIYIFIDLDGLYFFLRRELAALSQHRCH